MTPFSASVPSSWHPTRLRFCIDSSKNGAWGEEPGGDEMDVACVRVADFDWERLSIDLSNQTIRSISRDQFRKLALRKEDILIEKSGGGEKTPVGRVVRFRADIEAISSNFVARLRPSKTVDSRFLCYLLAALYLSKYSHQFIKQNTGIQNLDEAALLSTSVHLPQVECQRVIARFLDRETDRIDQLIAKKQQFIPLLREKREAVIAHAVTQGIDPKAPKRESGEAWLGMMPAHWQVVPPTALFTESKERARVSDQMLSSTQKYGVIPLAQFEELAQRQVTMAFLHLDRRKHVEVGNFVISMRSMDGGLERARAVGSVRSSYSVLRAGPDVDGRFYGALLKSSRYIQALRQTANFIRDGQDMNFSHFRKVRLPRLSVTEQSEIADHIEAETDRIDALIGLTERSVERLREYRAALITAAATGQIDVANWSRKGTTNARLDAIEAGIEV